MAETADTVKLVALIEANTKSFEKAMARLEGVTRDATTKATSNFAKLEKTLDRVGLSARRMIGFFGLASLGTAAAKLVQSTARMGDIADRIGITSEKLQELNFAAGQTGVEFEDLATALTKFGKTSADAAVNGGYLQKIFEANGKSLVDVNGNLKPFNDRLNDLADLVANAKNQEDALLIAQTAMGKSAGGLVVTFAQGSKGLQDFADKAREAGAVFDEKTSDAIKNFDDQLNQLTATLKATTLPALGTLIGYFNNVVDAYQKMSSTEFWKWSMTGPWWKPHPMGSGRGIDISGDAGIVHNTPSEITLNHPTVVPAQNDPKIKKFKDEVQSTMVEVDKVKDATQEWLDTLKDGLSGVGSTLMGVARGTESLGQAMTKTIERLEDMLADKAFQVILNYLFGGGQASPFGIFSSGAEARQKLSYGGPRAAGGPMMAGKGYLVGERGPEWVVPGRSSYVVPNGRMGGGGTQVHMHFEQGIDAQSRTTPTANGDRIDVMVKKAVRSEISSAMKPVLRDQYGIQPNTRRRF